MQSIIEKGGMNMKVSSLSLIFIFFMITLGCRSNSNIFAVQSVNKLAYISDTCKQGLWITTDSNSNIIIGTYKNCQLNGKVKIIFASGEVCVATYKNGLKNGVVRYYRKDGVVYLVQNYVKGKVVEEQTYSPKW
jgi:antitoxin component YwqK of YwqJK toxin-antitoxin module